MKNNLTITDFCKLDLAQQKKYIKQFCLYLNDLKEQFDDLEYKMEFDPFVSNFIEERIKLSNQIYDLEDEINNINEKIDIIKKIINNWTLIKNSYII